VTKFADIALSTTRIAVAKLINAGQVCTNVNHVLVDPVVRTSFVAAIVRHFSSFMGGREKQPKWFSRIVNERNFDTLKRLEWQTSGRIVYGDQSDRGSLFFATTAVTNVQPNDSLMSDELFGPILSVINADLSEPIAQVSKLEHPLAVDGFTRSQADKDRSLDETLSGRVTFDDCMLHAIVKDAVDKTFNWLETVGFGSYHGRCGIRAFTPSANHHRPAHMDRAAGRGAISARFSRQEQKMSTDVKVIFDRRGNDTSFLRVASPDGSRCPAFHAFLAMPQVVG
jgi:aldehyde dehydrogenase (NAD+)